MYVLITGGTGFLGSHLCKRLVAEGHKVFCVDNLQTSTTENIAALRYCDRFEFHKGDVRKIDSMIPVFIDLYEFDQVYNLACPASPPHYQKDPIGTMLTNVLGTNNCLEIAQRAGATMLQASTSEIYGDPECDVQDEEYRGNVNPIGPRACYNEGKRAAETLCFDYRRMHNVDAKIVRIFNTYGPGMQPDDGRVVSNFIMRALKDETITLYGDGMQTRSFCYVDDMIEGLIRMMNSRLAGPVNLGNPIELDMHHLAGIICGKIGSISHYEYKELPEDDPKVRCPRISRALNFLNWNPQVQLEEGLDKTIEHFRSLYALSPTIS